MSEQGIVNRVARSGIITLDLDEFYPQGERASIDLADQLWQGLALKEQDYRDWIATHDWQQYTGQHVALFCSADAIIPAWAYMLAQTQLTGVATLSHFGSAKELEAALWLKALVAHDWTQYTDCRVVIKGCADREVPEGAYMELVARLQPVAKAIMYGEACSTVPVWKRPKA